MLLHIPTGPFPLQQGTQGCCESAVFTASLNTGANSSSWQRHFCYAIKLPPAQLGPQGLGTKKDFTAFGSSQSFQNRELFPEGPPQQWGALIGSPKNKRVSVGEERDLISWFHGFPRLVPFYTRIYQRIKSKIRVTLNEVRHEALSVMSAHYHFANKKAKQKNIIAPKVEFTRGKNTHGNARK